MSGADLVDRVKRTYAERGHGLTHNQAVLIACSVRDGQPLRPATVADDDVVLRLAERLLVGGHTVADSLALARCEQLTLDEALKQPVFLREIGRFGALVEEER